MNKKKELLEEMGYKKDETKKPKRAIKSKSQVSRHNPSVHKNSQFGGF